jgi:uncharacterized protein YggE
MIRKTGLAALAALALLPAAPAGAQVTRVDGLAGAQTPPALDGTRLDITATGEVSRVPDIVRVTAGVATQAPTAAEALRQNAALMARVRAALARAGIADRDVQTQSLALSAVYRNGGYPRDQLTGYSASNDLIIRFRDVSGAGPILDALVAAGVTEIRGPMLGFDNPEAARDEARGIAIATARTRAQLYAQALGMRIKRVVAVSEAAQYQYGSDAVSGVVNFQGSNAGTAIDPGGRRLSATVNVVFELE